MYVYLLSDYGDYGSENMVGTINRNKLYELIDKHWNDPKINKDWLTTAKYNLEEKLLKSDGELEEMSPVNLHCGYGEIQFWGTMQLHVVEID